MRRALLIALAPLLLTTACYSEPAGEGQNPYMASKDSQPLVREPADDGSPAESDPATAAPAPERSGVSDPDETVSAPIPAPRETDLATDFNRAAANDAEQSTTIDPRLLDRGTPDTNRYEPIRPRTADSVRPAAGEAEIIPPADSPDAGDIVDTPQPAEEPAPAVEPPELAPPSLANDPGPAPVDDSTPATPENADPAAAEPLQPAVEDLATNPLADFDRSPVAPADSPPSLERPEVNSVNKPPLDDAAPTDESRPVDDMRPSERLLQQGEPGRNAVDEIPSPSQPIEPEPSPQPAPATPSPAGDSPQPAETPADGDRLPPGEATGFRTWVDSTGRIEMEGRFIRLEKAAVIMEVKDNEQISGRKLKTIEIPLERFSPEDREFIQRIQRGDFGI